MAYLVKLTLQFNDESFNIEVPPEEEARLNADPDYAYAVCLKLKQDAAEAMETSTKEFVWTDAAIFLLLEEYRKRRLEFRDPKKRKRDLWLGIEKEFQKHGYTSTIDTLDKKLRNLKQTYLRIKDNQNVKRRTGQAAIKWKFFKIISEIFNVEKDIAVECPPIESNPMQLQIPAGKSHCSIIEPLNSNINSLEIASTSSSDIIQPTHNSTLLSPIAQNSPAMEISSPKAIRSKIASPSTSRHQEDDDEIPKKKRMRRNLIMYRSEHLTLERERIAAIKMLTDSTDKNTGLMSEMVQIQRQKNELLKMITVANVKK